MKIVIDDRIPVGTISDNYKPKYESTENVVEIKDAVKCYGQGKKTQVVLNRLDMIVPKGVIYTLIGASGCGKTTLFSIIIGTRDLDSGEVSVLGETPGTKDSNIPGPKVGYMPQETALFNQFTISETLYYYGALNGVDKEVLDEKVPALMKMLDLPNNSQYAKTLSGGQQRRLSLAATLIHDPELLILDEPTVGIDPLVRERIWDYLRDICRSGEKTIIISTHYIEEAQSSDYIAMMRKGILIAETDRAYLQERYNENSLEKIFLHLARSQDCEQVLDKSINGVDCSESTPKRHSIQKTAEPRKKRPLIDKRHLDVLLRRNFLFIFRSLGVMAFILAGYTATVVCFCIAIGGIPNYLNVAVANLELSTADRLIANCPVISNNCTYELLSCKYLQYLDGQVNLIYTETENEAYDLVKNGKAWAAFYFTANYSLAYKTKVFDQGYSEDWTVDNSEIKVRWDGTSAPLNAMLRRKFHAAYTSYAKDIATECEINNRTIGIPMKLEEPIYGSFKHNFRDFPAPGFILTNIFFFAVASTACALISEKVTNSDERSFANGVKEIENLIAHFIPQLLMVSIQTFLILIFGFKVFGLTIYGSLVLTGLLMLSSGICGMCYGAVIAYFCTNERSAYYMAAGSFISATLTSDIMSNSLGIPPVLYHVLDCLPFLKAVTAMRALIYKGKGLSDPFVAKGFLNFSMWTGIFLLIVYIIIKAKKKEK